MNRGVNNKKICVWETDSIQFVKYIECKIYETFQKLANEQLTTTPILAPEATSVQNQLEQDQQLLDDQPLSPKSDKDPLENVKVMYNGRDILDICSNIKNSWNVRYTYLPENNFTMYLANRSQYHRLGSSWNTKEYSLDLCTRCCFQYPVKYKEKPSSETDDIMPLVTIYPDNHRLTLKIGVAPKRINAINNQPSTQPPPNHGNINANYNPYSFKPATPNSFYMNNNNNINNNNMASGYNGMGIGMGNPGSGTTTPKPYPNINRPHHNQSGINYNNNNNNKMPYKMYSHF